MKILNYSPATYRITNQQQLLHSTVVFDKLMENNFSKDYFLYDRTQSIPHFLDIDHSYSPIPQLNYNLSFNDIVKNRCLELLSKNKIINVCWSGGLDSTFVLFSLYHYANDKDQICVHGTYNSIIESGDLFDKHIKNNIKYKIQVNTFNQNNFSDENCIYVTGSMSNQLFIPGLSYNSNRDCILQLKDNLEIKSCADEPYDKVLTENCVEFLTPSIFKSQRKINTLQDLRWYINFNFTWYNVLSYSLVGLGDQRSKNIFAFFNSEQFQSWAIHNKDIITKTGDYTDERWQIREGLKNYIKDSMYPVIKKKHKSVLSPVANNWLYLFNDFTNEYI